MVDKYADIAAVEEVRVVLDGEDIAVVDKDQAALLGEELDKAALLVDSLLAVGMLLLVVPDITLVLSSVLWEHQLSSNHQTQIFLRCLRCKISDPD